LCVLYILQEKKAGVEMIMSITNGLAEKMRKENELESEVGSDKKDRKEQGMDDGGKEESSEQQKDILTEFFVFLCKKMKKPSVLSMECRLFINIYKKVKRYVSVLL
jgi:hypothetical protein